MTETTYEGKYIRFVHRAAGPKTMVWSVMNNDGEYLGVVRWFGSWRKYAYEPERAVFEEVCLRDIADFIVARTREHREALKVHA